MVYSVIRFFLGAVIVPSLFYIERFRLKERRYLYDPFRRLSFTSSPLHTFGMVSIICNDELIDICPSISYRKLNHVRPGQIEFIHLAQVLMTKWEMSTILLAFLAPEVGNTIHFCPPKNDRTVRHYTTETDLLSLYSGKPQGFSNRGGNTSVQSQMVKYKEVL